MGILLRDGCLVTMNPRREMISSGFVAIDDDGSIASVGPTGTEPDDDFDRIVDATGTIVTPGFINLHQHHWYNLFKGLAGGMLLEDWVSGLLLPCAGRLGTEDLRISAYLAALEMIGTGTTTCLNHSVTTTMEEETAATIEPMAELGFRQVFAKDFRCRTPANPDHPHDAAAASAYIGDLVHRWDGARGGLVRLALAIESNAHWIVAGMSSEALNVAGHRLAAERGLRITNHAAGGTMSSDKGYLKYVRETGRTDIAHLMQLGVLDERWLLIHVINLSDSDIEMMRRSGCHAVYTPTSESMRGGGIGPWRTLDRAGINVALGTDGPMVDYSVDMVEQMKACLYLQNVKHLDAGAFSPERVMEMATIDAARALGMEDEIGSIEPGKRADLAVFDMRAPHLQVVHNPIVNLVCCARGGDTCMVVIDGRIVMEDGEFLGFADVDGVVRDATERGRAIIEAAGLHELATPRWPTSTSVA